MLGSLVRSLSVANNCATIFYVNVVRKNANVVNGFTGFFGAAPPASILPLADTKIRVQGSPHRKKPVNPFTTFAFFLTTLTLKMVV